MNYYLIKKTKVGEAIEVEIVTGSAHEDPNDCWRELIKLENNPPLSHVINFGYAVEREQFLPGKRTP